MFWEENFQGGNKGYKQSLKVMRLNQELKF